MEGGGGVSRDRCNFDGVANVLAKFDGIGSKVQVSFFNEISKILKHQGD